jgi:S1 RNA binding domain protein
MAIEVGAVAEGKVTGITRWGAFVTLADGTVGMVHISEISYQYVNDINEALTLGQSVKVKVTAIDENGRVAFSIKRAVPPPPRPPRPNPAMPRKAPPRPAPEEMTFEDKLKEFMQTSDSRISDLKHYTDRKNGGNRRGRK